MGSNLKGALVNSRDPRRSDRNPLLEEEIVSIMAVLAHQRICRCITEDLNRGVPLFIGGQE